MPKVEEKAESPKKEKKAKVEEPKIDYVTSRKIADDLGIRPASLRRYLRSLPSFQDEGYTRYKWDPNKASDMKQVADIKSGYAKHAESEKEKTKKRLEDIKAKKAKAEEKEPPVKAKNKSKEPVEI